MANGALINARVSYGFAKAGSVLGFPYQWYRPTADTQPISPGNLLGSIIAYITTDASLKSSVPPTDVKSLWFGAYDMTNTEPGDYFVGDLGTFFIASQFLPAPPSLVYCNTIFTIERPAGSTPSPAARFGTALNPVVMADSFPGWLKSAERRTNPELAQPGDVPLPSANILLPKSIPYQLARGDIIHVPGNPARIYNVQSADKLFSAWNVTALLAGG